MVKDFIMRFDMCALWEPPFIFYICLVVAPLPFLEQYLLCVIKSAHEANGVVSIAVVQTPHVRFVHYLWVAHSHPLL